LKWRFKTGEDPLIHNQVGFQGSPAIADGVVYVGCRDAHFYAIDAASGTAKWSFDNHGTWIVDSPSLIGDRVLFGTSDPGFLDVFDKGSGKAMQQLPQSGFVFSSPAVADEVAYVGLLNGTFVAVDLKTGKQLWEFQTDLSRQNRGFYLKADKTMNEPMLFPSSWDNNVLAVERVFSLGAIASSPLVVNGMVYFGSTDGYLYALY
jgi:outer membrane protein assembly factor BamB